MFIVGMAAREDGSRLNRDNVQGKASESIKLGRELGSRLVRALSPEGGQ
jgi:hypothetical protein